MAGVPEEERSASSGLAVPGVPSLAAAPSPSMCSVLGANPLSLNSTF